jgi:Peptidase family M23
MSFFRYSTYVIMLLLLACNSPAQNNQKRFSSPLNIPLLLSGNFCEVRSDHFHSGIDIKTNGKEGLPVFAVDDGYIYRVKVSAVGYGKALYIKHANNIVSVYGHLSEFIGSLAKAVEDRQYSGKSFETEFFPDSNLFKVTKGMQIAWSGNSGGSQAPHLHFEIRDQRKEEPLNPLLFDWAIEDTIAPEILKLNVYDYYEGYFSDKNYADINFKNNDTISVYTDSIGLSFECNDYMNDSSRSDLGIYSAVLLADKDTVYHYKFDRMNFDQTRYVNAYIDYSKKDLDSKIFQRLYTLPGNKSDIFKKAGIGIIQINQKKIVPVKLIVGDANGSLSSHSVYLKAETQKKGSAHKLNIKYPNKAIIRKWPEAELTIKPGSFYEPLMDLKIEKRKPIRGFPVISVGNKGIIFHQPYLLKFKVPKKYSGSSEKLCVVSLNEQGRIINSLNTAIKENKVVASSRKPGIISIAADTIPPLIDSLYFTTDTIANKSFYIIKATDNLSGIKNYTCKIDGKWFLFEYDPKNNRLFVDVKKLPSNFTLDIELEDNCRNVIYKRVEVRKPLF